MINSERRAAAPSGEEGGGYQEGIQSASFLSVVSFFF